jgi:hypothetical protein
MWLDFSNSTIINLHNTTWNQDYVVILENITENSWIYLVITAMSANEIGKNAKRSFFPVAHPVCLIPHDSIFNRSNTLTSGQIHLRGHGFAVIAQGTNYSEISRAILSLTIRRAGTSYCFQPEAILSSLLKLIILVHGYSTAISLGTHRAAWR